MKSKAAKRNWTSSNTGDQIILFENPMDNVKLSFYGITSGYAVTIEDYPIDSQPVPIDGYNTVGASGSDFNYVQTTESGRFGTSFIIPGHRRGLKIAVTLGATTSLDCFVESWHSAEPQGKAKPADTIAPDGANEVEYSL